MLEALLQKILKRIFGNFIDGLGSDKLHLGIWSGKLVIENVSFKKQIFQMFSLPFVFIHSIIKKLIITVPWKSISSIPVQITLQSMLLVISQKQKQKWQKNKAKELEIIIKNLNQFITKFLKRLIQNQKSRKSEQKQEKGFFDNIYIRVFDNLQISIRNIHIKFEDTITKKYSFGITLESIEIFTCNQNKQKLYLDRTSSKNNKQLLRKYIQIKNFGIYWKQRENNYLFDKDKIQIEKILEDQIFKKNKYSPLNYLFMINFQTFLKQRRQSDLSGPRYQIELDLKDLRICISKLILQQFISLMQFRNEYLERKITESYDPIPENFNKLLEKYYKYYDNENIQSFFSLQQKQQFSKILLKFKFERIKQIVQNIIKQEYKKELKLKFIRKKNNTILQQNQLNQLQKVFQKLSKDKNQKKIQLPKDFIFLDLKLRFTQISICLNDASSKDIFSLTLYKLLMGVKMSKIQIMYKFQIKDVTSFGSKQILWRDRNPQLLFLKADIVENTQTLYTKIIVNISSIIFLYDIATVENLKQFLKIEINSSLRNKALDKVDQISYQLEQNIEKKKMNLQYEIVIDVPKILLNQCKNQWNLYFGEIYLCKKQSKVFMKLKNLKAQCYNTTEVFTFINPFIIDIQMIKQQINISVSQIKIKINKFYYISLNNLIKSLKTNINKSEILSKSTKRAIVYLKEKNWKKTLANISQGKIYFWDKKQYPVGYVTIRKVLLKLGQNKENTIYVGDKKKTSFIFKFQDQVKMKQWVQELQNIASIQLVDKKPNIPTNDDIKIKINAKINKFEIIVLQNKFGEWLRIQILELQLKVIQRNLSSQMCVYLQNLIINSLDFNFIQKNSKEKNFLEYNVQTISEYHPNYNKINKFSLINLSKIQVKFNPNLILKIFNFIDLNQIQFQQFHHQQETLQKQNQQTILNKTQINLQGLNILLINKKTSLPLANVQLSKSKINIQEFYYEESMSGQIGNLRIFDQTNYPDTIYQRKNSKIKPQQIWGTSGSQNNGFLQFKYIKLKDGSKKIVNKRYKQLYLTLSTIKLTYIHQPVLRIIDYLLVQFLGVLDTPDFFQEYHDQNFGTIRQKKFEQYDIYIRKREETLKIKQLNHLGKHNILKSLQDPRQLYMIVQFINPKLLLISENNRGIQIKIGRIKIENQFFFSADRIISSTIKQVLCQRYKFSLEEILIVQFQKEERIYNRGSIMQQSFSIYLSIQMFLKENQYRFICDNQKKITLDTTFDIKMLVTPIYFTIDKENLLQLLKIIELNILYQDGLEIVMIHDYIKTDPVKYRFQADFQNLNLSLKSQNKIIAQFDIQGMRISNTRKSKLIKSLQVNIISIETKFLKNDVYKQIVSKRKYMRFSTNRKNVSLLSSKNSFIYQIPAKQFFKQICFSLSIYRSELQHSIKIKLNDLALVFELDFLYFLMKFFELPKISYPKKFNLKQAQPKIQTICQIQKNYTFEGSKNLISFYIANTQKIINICFSILVNIANNDIKIIGKDTEIFFCNINDVSAENINNIKKRTFMQKINFEVSQFKKEEKLHLDINISKIIIKFSIKDMKNLLSLSSEIQKKCKYIVSQRQNSNQKSLIKQQNEIGYMIEVKKLPSLQILLINDTSQRYFPIIYSRIQLIQNLPIQFTNPILSLNLQFKIEVKYFNLKISIWEPILQQSQLKLKLIYNKKQIHESELALDKINKQEYLRIDFSTNFLQTIIKTNNDIQLEFKNPTYELCQIDNLNSWVIYNYTGYTIKCLHQLQQVIQSDNKCEIYIKSTNIEKSIIDSHQTDTLIQINISYKYEIKNINIKSEDIQKIRIFPQGKQNQPKKSYNLIKIVKIDISKNIKHVYFLSPLLLINSTSLQYQLIFNQKQSIPFLINSTKSIPFDVLNTRIKLKKQAFETQNIELDLNFQKKFIQLGNYRLNIKTVFKEYCKRIYFQPPYKITNLFPVKLYLNFKIKDRFYQFNFTEFNQKNIVSIPFYDNIQQSQIALYLDIPSLQWSQYQKFGQGQIQLQDLFGKSIVVKIKKIKNQDETSINYIIYPSNILQNKSQEDIVFCNATRRKLAGQRQEKHNKLIFISDQNTITIRQKGQENCSQLIRLSENPTSFMIKLKKQNYQQQVNVYTNMVIICSIVNIYTISFRKYELHSKFILYNKADGQLIIRHADAFTSETIKIQQQNYSNMYWFNEQYYKSIRITFNGQNWEWSSPLNIQKSGITHFILRDRSNFRKVMFMSLIVTINKGVNRIQIKNTRNKQQYPFSIINELPQVNILIPSLRVTLKSDGENQAYFSWDDPIKQLYQIEVVLQPKHKQNYFKQRIIYIKQKKVQNQIIEIKSSLGIMKIQIDIFTKLSQKVIKFKLYQQEIQKKALIKIQLNFPLTISIINNSLSKSVNLFSLYCLIHFNYMFSIGPGNEYKDLKLKLDQIQIDNNTNIFVYYPVVLKTNFQVRGIGKQNWIQFEFMVNKIILKIQQDFIYELYGAYTIIKSFLPSHQQESNFFISRIILPKLQIDLCIQAKKLSIETPITLQKPSQCSYPWEIFPYPIKSIVLSLLSSMSISPLTFISSLHEGVIHLFNDTQASRGVQGFLTKIIQSFSNGINGMVRILVGDMQRIDNFVDGVQSGVSLFTKTSLSTFVIFYNEPTPLGLLKTITGFFIKPVTGILQLTYKISEGIKNTTRFKFQRQELETRKRYPIIFFGRQQFYKQYENEHGEIMTLLHYCQGGKLQGIELVEYFYLPDLQKSLIILSSSQILSISSKKKKCFWKIEIENIAEIKLREENLSENVFLKEESQYFTSKIITIVINQKQKLKRFHQLLNDLLKTSFT